MQIGSCLNDENHRPADAAIETLMSNKHTDSYIEKNFLYLLALSILLHLAVAILFNYLPEKKKVAKEEPIMIDLQDLPPSKEAPAPDKKDVKRFAEERHRVARETAPKGLMEREKITPRPKWTVPPVTQTQRPGREAAPWQPERGTNREKQTGEDLLIHRKAEPTNLAKLFPKADRMARLEENYRKKYGLEVEDGDITNLNTNDFILGSFMRRFETMIYGVWNYPEEALTHGIIGKGVVLIIFNRKGQIEKMELLESTGSVVLDKEFLRTLQNIGVLGPLPKAYRGDHLYLVDTFEYTLIGGASRSMH